MMRVVGLHRRSDTCSQGNTTNNPSTPSPSLSLSLANMSYHQANPQNGSSYNTRAPLGNGTNQQPMSAHQVCPHSLTTLNPTP